MIVELSNTAESWDKVFRFMSENDRLLPDPLSGHVRLDDHCTKLLTLGRVFVSCEDDAQDVISGICMGYINDLVSRVAHLQVLIVNDRFQGRGLGEKLVRRFIEEAEKAEMKTVELTCDKPNERAAALYRKIGFRPSEVIHPNEAKRFLVYDIYD